MMLIGVGGGGGGHGAKMGDTQSVLATKGSAG